MSEPRFPRPPQTTSPIIWFLLALLLVLLALSGWFLRDRWHDQAASPPGAAQHPQRTVTLFFAARDGSGLVAEDRQINDCLINDECLAPLVQALLDGPRGALTPVFPPRTTLRGVSLTPESVLQVDFARNLVDHHPGGSWVELLTVQALANTVATNFPHYRQVRILIDGAAVDTLKGHLDLRQPLNPDFSLVLPVPAGAAPIPAGRPQ